MNARSPGRSEQTEPAGPTQRIDRWASVLAISTLIDRTDSAGTVTDFLGAPARARNLEALSLMDGRVDTLGRPSSRSAVPVDQANSIAMIFIRSGRGVAGGGPRRFELLAGDTLFWDGGDPLTFEAAAEVQSRILLFPRASVIQLCPEHDALLGKPIRHKTDLVGTLFGVVDLFRVRLPALGPSIRHSAADLLLQLLNELSPATDRLDQDPQQRRLISQILEYIEDNLGDPALTPPGIAAAHAISLRTLYSLFRHYGPPVGTHIRDRRLSRGYQDLLQNAGEPVARIARRWGFASAAHFSRLFRERHGMPPSHLRNTFVS
ncbi:helix-turn-helix domain-containing protein [Actinoplanes sp. NPDC051411]|uniref:helix-turn-helix domain-containing protein n=1 Tax=Actinoplanes sp. NPDC051411 TaxID=3155522 RepID=UPI00342468C3